MMDSDAWQVFRHLRFVSKKLKSGLGMTLAVKVSCQCPDPIKQRAIFEFGLGCNGIP